MSETIRPAEMTPEERLHEVAVILARGVLRLHTRKALPAEKLSDSGRNKLDSRRDTTPDVSVLNAQDLSEKGGTSFTVRTVVRQVYPCHRVCQGGKAPFSPRAILRFWPSMPARARNCPHGLRTLQKAT